MLDSVIKTKSIILKHFQKNANLCKKRKTESYIDEDLEKSDSNDETESVIHNNEQD